MKKFQKLVAKFRAKHLSKFAAKAQSKGLNGAAATSWADKKCDEAGQAFALKKIIKTAAATADVRGIAVPNAVIQTPNGAVSVSMGTLFLVGTVIHLPALIALVAVNPIIAGLLMGIAALYVGYKTAPVVNALQNLLGAVKAMAPQAVLS